MTSTANDSTSALAKTGRRKFNLSISLTPYARKKLDEMAANKGVTRSSMAEIAIRERAEKERRDRND